MAGITFPGRSRYVDRSSPGSGSRGTDQPTLRTLPDEPSGRIRDRFDGEPAQPSPQSAPSNAPFGTPDQLAAFRRAAEGARAYEDQTDTNVLNDPRFRSYVTTGTYTPSGQAWPDAERAGANFGRQPGPSPQPPPPGNPGAGTFDDPWTSQLEKLINDQLRAVTSPPENSPQAQLTRFLLDQFQKLSANPGYTPEQQAVLRTQAFEPLEDRRQAAKRRALEVASARGFLPSSGLTDQVEAANGGLEPLDVAYDRMRTVLDRDLSINAINRQDADLVKALQMISGANAQDQQARQQALNLSTLLYQLPINAQQNASAVINGTGSPASLLGQVIQLAQANQNNSADWFRSLGLYAGLGG